MGSRVLKRDWQCERFREPLIKSFDRLRTNGIVLIPFVVSLSNHIQIRLDQRLFSDYISMAAHLRARFCVDTEPRRTPFYGHYRAFVSGEARQC